MTKAAVLPSVADAVDDEEDDDERQPSVRGEGRRRDERRVVGKGIASPSPAMNSATIR